MNKEEFLKHQFLTLREEVKETKARIFKIQTIGLVIAPGSTILGRVYGIDILITNNAHLGHSSCINVPL